MGALYLGSLILGMGILLMQILMSSGKDMDAGGKTFDFAGGADADLDLHADADVNADADAHGHDVEAQGATSVGALFLSFRFWTFALAGFGLVGAPLHFTGLASANVTFVCAAVVALIAGLGASWTFQTLKSANLNSGADAKEIVGQVGKVLLPPNASGHAKVRLLVKGQMIDYLATSDETSLEMGSSVLVEEVRGNEIHVSPAPAGLEYSDDQH